MSSVASQPPFVSLSLVDIDSEERHRNIRRDEILSEIKAADEKMVETSGRLCPVCGAKMYSHGQTKGREVWALCGMIVVKLKRLRCPCCKKLTVPGTELIGDGLLSSVAEKFVELCRFTTFANARRLLNKMLGIDIPTMTLHSYIQAQSAYFDDEIVKATQALFETGSAPKVDAKLKEKAPLYLSVDEGLMHEWSYCHGKKKRDGHKHYVTAYAGVFFDGRKCISGSGARKKRYSLTNRYGHASATTSIDQFFSELVMLSYKRGYSSSHPLFILTDGARYLASAIETHFPAAIHLLDIFHLKRRVTELIGESHPLYRDATAAIGAYSPSRLLKCIYAFQPADTREYDLKCSLVTYVSRNAPFITNHRHPKTGVHGSASAEKAVDLLIARRFKNRGMSWTESGCEALLYFQVLAYNKELESYWSARHSRPQRSLGAAQHLPKTPVASLSGHNQAKQPAFYHQVHIADCEATKGINLN
jgi:hypothetical protein